MYFDTHKKRKKKKRKGPQKAIPHSYHTQESTTTDHHALFQGWFDTTELYYGTYSSEDVSLAAHQHYSMPKAYFLVIFVLFIVYLVVILRRCVVELRGVVELLSCVPIPYHASLVFSISDIGVSVLIYFYFFQSYLSCFTHC